jgi:hypothetical protein
MPVPVFAVGEVLTAADMNQIGLYKVASGTLSSTATNFVGCFTSNYRNYRIVVDQISLSATGEIFWRTLSGTTAETSGYRFAYLGYTTQAATANSNNNAAAVASTGFSTSTIVDNVIIGSFTMDIFGPAIAQRTFSQNHAYSFPNGNAFRIGGCLQNNSSAYDGIQFLTNSAVTMSGNVTIYGYRT